MMDKEILRPIIQAALMASDQPVNIEQLLQLFDEEDGLSKNELSEVLSELQKAAQDSCFCLQEVANGFRYQIKTDYAKWLSRLWQERTPRYSRALLETLVIIAYRQPVTRGDIEEVRGVAVSSSIIKTLLEREWIRVVGQRDVVGKPGIYGTTKTFLDYFNLKSLSELPTLEALKNLDEIAEQLDMSLQLPVAENDEEAIEIEQTDNEQIVNHESEEELEVEV